MKIFANFRAIAAGAILVAASGWAQASDFLVDSGWLQKNLTSKDVRVFEVSVDTGVYERGHIPGAVKLDWHTELVNTQSRDIASREAFEQKMRDAGIGKDTTIVLYGDNNNWFAAWGAWVFEVYGLGGQVKLLDGGRKLWEAKGLPLDTAIADYPDSSITLPERNTEVRARLSDVLDVVEGRTTAKLIDIRSKDEFEGRIFAPEGVKELAVRAGHIPGAVNVPWGKIVQEDGRFKPVDEIKAIYAAAGIDGTQPIITYCRIGERSSHSWFALTKLLGYNVRNYDGSWTEYGNSVGVPVVNVAGTVWTGK